LSLPATIRCNRGLLASTQGLGRRAESQAIWSA
jgi:hypothetical protein